MGNQRFFLAVESGTSIRGLFLHNSGRKKAGCAATGLDVVTNGDAVRKNGYATKAKAADVAGDEAGEIIGLEIAQNLLITSCLWGIGFASFFLLVEPGACIRGLFLHHSGGVNCVSDLRRMGRCP